MDCQRYEAALREHALGEPLSPALETHLASCEACREKLAVGERLRGAIDTTLDRLRQVEPSPAFLARARTAARDGSLASPRFGWLGGLGWSALPAAAVLALAVGVIVTHERWLSEPTRPMPPASPPTTARATPPEPMTSVPRPQVVPRAVPPPDARGRAAASEARAPEDRLAVLVPPGQEEAIVRLASLVATGVATPPASLVNPPDPTQPLTPSVELSLPPLAIEPLGSGAAENEGVMP
jgi:hypothetical protein